MSEKETFYVKDKDGNFIPMDIRSIFNKDFEEHLVIVRVGSEENPASMKDVEMTEESFLQAGVLDGLKNMSIMITPYEIEIKAEDKEALKDKVIYLQIVGGDDVLLLEGKIRKLYSRLKKKNNNAVVLPSPLKVKDYRKVQEVLKRSMIRKERRRGRR